MGFRSSVLVRSQLNTQRQKGELAKSDTQDGTGGRVSSRRQLTVSQGQISDDLGRDIPTLQITR